MGTVRAATELTVATWNTQGKARPAMLALLNEVRPDVLFVQEVRMTTWLTLLASSDWSGAFGLNLRPRQEGEGGKRALGAAILVRSPMTLLDASVITHDGFAWPERGVTGLVTPAEGGESIRLVAYHALHGGHGTIKPATSQALGYWLSKQTGRVLVGMDANSPWVDHPDESRMEACWEQHPVLHATTMGMERALLGPRGDRKHDLADVWRTFLGTHEEQAEAIRAASPDGPLATTHYTGRGLNREPRRYDHLWATDDFRVLDVKHMEEGFAAGSDHALVVARLGY